MLGIVSTVSLNLFDYIVGLGFDAGKDGIKKKFDQRKLKKALKEYVQHNLQIRDADSLDAEIDYTGLIEYIRDNFLDEVSVRIYDFDPKKRGHARSDIVSHAIIYCHAETEAARGRVTDFVCGCLDIYKNFYKNIIPSEVYLIASEVIDMVNDHTDDTADELSERINQVQTTVENASIYSLDAINKDAANRDLKAIAEKITSQLEVASMQHKLAPYYKFDYKEGELISKAAIPEAKERYPERYVLKGKGHIDDHRFTTWPEMESYAYRHQMPIIINVESVKKFLGDIEDPAQPDINKIKDKQVYAYPPKFPPAFPCSIKIGEETFFDYILLRTQEIKDDGTYVINNREQKNCSLFVELQIRRIDPEHATGTTNLRFDLKEAKHKEYLQYARFMKMASQKQDVTIHLLDHNADLLRGKIGDIHYNIGFKDVNEEIDFLERVVDIDTYIGKELELPDQFTNGEYHTFIMVSDLIRGKDITGTWNNSTLNGIVDQHFRDSLREMGKGPHELSAVGITTKTVFGQEIKIQCLQCYKEAFFDGYEKMVQLADLLDDGEQIKIKLVPGKNKGYVETTNIPDAMKLDEKNAV